MLITLKAVFISEIKDSLAFLVVFLVPERQFNSTSTSFFSLLFKAQFIILQIGGCWFFSSEVVKWLQWWFSFGEEPVSWVHSPCSLGCEKVVLPKGYLLLF